MLGNRFAGTRRIPPYATVSQFFSRGRGGAGKVGAFQCLLLLGFRTKEQRFPKPQVAGPIPAEGARTVWVSVECHMPQAARTYDGRSEILGTADTVCE